MRTGAKRLLMVLGVAVVSATGLVACSDDSGSSAKRTTTTTAAATITTTAAGAGPVAGTYTNAGASDPHYSLVLQTSNGTGIGGTMTFVFQDGTTQQTFTFSGTASGGSADVTPSSGSAITFTYTSSQLTFANCSAYLQFATQASQCTFTLQ